MQTVTDHLIAALDAHRKGNVPAAVDHYRQVFECATDIRNTDIQCLFSIFRQFNYYHFNGTRAGNTIEKNGELFALKTIDRFGSRTIFDVGANIGYWALTAQAANPNATIHSFEIFPETYGKLAANVGSRERIVANAFGLAGHDGTALLQYAEGVDSAHFTTVFSFDNGRQQACPVMRGDRYMAENGIERIDFLKIDVEGGEHDVLTGFVGALGRGCIPVIQFEYGPASLDSRKLLKDYYALLGDHGYSIGRLYAGGANFRPYAIEEENFINANFIACLDSERALREALTLR